ncbi:putative phospholipid-transporting ATPase IM [Urocitellus parryii]
MVVGSSVPARAEGALRACSLAAGWTLRGQRTGCAGRAAAGRRASDEAVVTTKRFGCQHRRRLSGVWRVFAPPPNRSLDFQASPEEKTSSLHKSASDGHKQLIPTPAGPFPPQVERIVKANDREYNEKFQYADNRIHTSKYNILTFLPINLFEQFQRVANAYFLFLLILQLIPEISSLTWFTTIVPLVLVITMTAVKDATDDYFRHKSDNQVNNRQSEVIIDSKLQNEKWMNVKVGDIVKLENNQFVAADLLLLSSSEPHGLCYIETAELDGETNLKVRHALSVTSELGADISRLARFDGIVVCEAPNNKLDKFTGVLSWKDSKHSLDNQKIILRGCILRNTSWCFGMVIFAGPDTKLMQNSGKTKFKRTSIDRLMNTLVLWIFGFLVCLGIILAIGNSIWENQVGGQFRTFLFWSEGEKNSVFSGFLTFWSYIIILNTVVPISLYVR